MILLAGLAWSAKRLAGQAVRVMEPGPQSRQVGRDGSQEPIQLPRQGSQGVSILSLVGVS